MRTKFKTMLYVCLIFSLVFTLVGCVKKEVHEGTVNQGEATGHALFEQSKKLGDAAVAYYLGKDVDSAYTQLFSQIPRLVVESKMLYLDDKAVSLVKYQLTQSALYLSNLQELELASGGSTDAVGRLDTSVTDMFDAYFIRGKRIPMFKVLDSDAKITKEFTDWYLEQAKEAGLLDTRLNYSGADSSLTVLSDDCSASKGGINFKVFGEIFSVPAESVGVTQDDILNAPKYVIDVDSFKFYDTGIFAINYITKASTATDESIKITVSFRYVEPVKSEQTDDLRKFLEGVTDFEFIQR